MISMQCQMISLSQDFARELTFAERFSRRWSITRRRAIDILRRRSSFNTAAGKSGVDARLFGDFRQTAAEPAPRAAR
jgi:hypothetical protein